MKSFLKYITAAALFAGVAVSDTTSVTLHIIGDSTVCAYRESAYPQTGWGQVIGSFFDESKVRVNNVAIGGRSSKTFIEEGRLAGLKASVSPGDVIMVQFGHNDRYFGSKPREVPFDSLGYWLQQYVDSAKAWGATPIFVSPMNMNMGANGRNIFTEYNVTGKMEELAKKNGIPFVNLNSKSYNAYSKNMNAAYVSRYLFKFFMPGEYPNYPDGVSNDGTTHFQESGSVGHSQWIAEELESALANESYVTGEAKSSLTHLVSSLKPRYNLNVKSTASNSAGLITHNQQIPGGAPLTLHVSPGSFGKKFLYWADDDCNQLTTDSNYYGNKMPYRSVTYTAVFEGGSCSKIAHDEEVIPTSSSSVESSSSIESSSSFNAEVCFTGVADGDWKSPIDMSKPDVGEGTTDSNHEGFTGIGFFNIANSATSKAVYNITSDQSASNARVMIRYAFAGTTNRDMKFKIDNGIYDVSFPPTGDWKKWDTTYIEDVWVDALDFTLTIESTTADGGPNIDMIAFDMKDVYRTGCSPAKVPEAESSSSVENSSSSSCGDNCFENSAESLRRTPLNRNLQPNSRVRQFNLLGRTVGKNKARGVYVEKK